MQDGQKKSSSQALPIQEFSYLPLANHDWFLGAEMQPRCGSSRCCCCHCKDSKASEKCGVRFFFPREALWEGLRFAL